MIILQKDEMKKKYKNQNYLSPLRIRFLIHGFLNVL